MCVGIITLLQINLLADQANVFQIVDQINNWERSVEISVRSGDNFNLAAGPYERRLTYNLNEKSFFGDIDEYHG